MNNGIMASATRLKEACRHPKGAIMLVKPFIATSLRRKGCGLTAHSLWRQAKRARGTLRGAEFSRAKARRVCRGSDVDGFPLIDCTELYRRAAFWQSREAASTGRRHHG